MPDNTPDNEKYESLNLETGLLEDIEEVRGVGIEVVEMLQMLIHSPAVRIAGPGVILDISTFSVMMESMLRPMSQAEFYTKLGDLVGVNPFVMGMEIARRNLSITLPITHPQATKMRLDPLDPSSPYVQDSLLLSSISKREQEEKEAKKPEEKVDLPPGLENFLRDLMNKSEETDSEKE